MEIDYKAIGQRIKIARIKKGITQEAVADLIDNAPDASNLSSFIRKLRLKIEPYPDNPRYIITVWGVGYKFSGEEKP